MTTPVSASEAYLLDFHARKPGATTKQMANAPVVVGGVAYPSSYAYLAASAPTSARAQRIVDLGCGDGYLLGLIAARRLPEAKLIGLDISGPELAMAHALLAQGASLVRSRAQQIALADGTVDLVVSHLALMLMDDIATVLAEIRRILKPGGRLCTIIGGHVMLGEVGDAIFRSLRAAAKRDGATTLPLGDPRMGTPEGIAALLAEDFAEVSVTDIDARIRVGPEGLWNALMSTYTVDVLSKPHQAALRGALLAAVEPLVEADGKLATGWRLLHLTASARNARDSHSVPAAHPAGGAPSPVSISTSLFTDIEGSALLWEQEPDRMPGAIARHDALLRKAVEGAQGQVVKTTGDGLYAAFDDPLDAVNAALAIQLAVADPASTNDVRLPIRCGVHVGAVERRDDDFFGRAVNRAARIMGAAHGGQVLLSQAVADLVGDRLPPAATLRDLGVLKLRDLASPEHVHQLVHPRLRQDFPALRALQATPNNLPQQVTSFVGREHESTEVKRLLSRTRILTLLGVGGIGKTRLALQLASELMDAYPDGVWFADLAPIADPALVPDALSHVWGVHEDAHHSLIRALCSFAQGRRLLLVLDNCEHLLDVCRRLTDALIHAGPGVRILATSREPLQIAGEQTYPLPALSLPDPKADVASLARSDAVRLFVDRARLQRPDFALGEDQAPAVIQLCTRLDGIPLALELAAARLSALPIDKIVARLDDRFRLLTGGSRTAVARQRTLRALIDWSYDLLGDDEKRVFARLAVFAGGWTLDAAEAVCAGDGLAQDDVLDLMTSLVQKSLAVAHQSEDRYRMLETIREYALERLSASGEGAEVRNGHHRYFAGLVEEAERSLRDRIHEAKWFRRLELERDNLDAALNWGMGEQGLAESAVRICGGLFRFWEVRGHWREGRKWCSAILARYGGSASKDATAQALLTEGQMTFRLGEIAAARALVVQALDVAREAGNRRLEAAALNNLSDIVSAQGDFATAETLLEQAVAINRELGNTAWEMINLDNLGSLYISQGKFRAARPAHERVLTLSREVGDAYAEATASGNLGLLARHRGDFGEAQALIARALALYRELGAPAEEVEQLLLMADAAVAQGELAFAKRHFRQALAASRELGYRRGVARALDGMVALAVEMRAFTEAARLCGGADAQRASIGVQQSPYDIEQGDQLRAHCRSELGDVGWDVAHAEGSSVSSEATIARALEWLEKGGDG